MRTVILLLVWLDFTLYFSSDGILPMVYVVDVWPVGGGGCSHRRPVSGQGKVWVDL